MKSSICNRRSTGKGINSSACKCQTNLSRLSSRSVGSGKSKTKYGAKSSLAIGLNRLLQSNSHHLPCSCPELAGTSYTVTKTSLCHKNDLQMRIYYCWNLMRIFISYFLFRIIILNHRAQLHKLQLARIVLEGYFRIIWITV